MFDPGGNLYFADSANNRIRKIDTHGIITTDNLAMTTGHGVAIWFESPVVDEREAPKRA